MLLVIIEASSFKGRGVRKYLITRGLIPLSWVLTDLEPTWAPFTSTY